VQYLIIYLYSNKLHTIDSFLKKQHIKIFVLSKTLKNFSYMFRSLLDHHQGDIILVLTSVTKILMWQHSCKWQQEMNLVRI